jgi:Putative porin
MHSASLGAARLQAAPLSQRLTHIFLGAGLTVTAAIALATPSARADDTSVLLSILERKGILTKSEAETVRAELAREKAKEAKIAAKSAPVSPSEGGLASKIDISKSIDKLKLYGHLRLRYQYDDKDPQLFIPDGTKHHDVDRSPSGSQQSRWRFRLRLGAEITLTDQWSAGFELSTQKAADSGNQTFENGFDDYDIFISKAFLRWDPNKAFTFIGGKFANPFYTTDLVWDPDITPNGITEIIRFDQLFGGESEEEAYSKDGKAIKAVKSERNWELSLVAGQFLFDDNNENNFDNDESTDSYVFETQLVGSYKFANGVKLTVAPGWLVENAGSVTGVTNNNPFNDSPNVSGATRNINLLVFPGDVSFKLFNTKAKFYWDFAYNIEGRKRTEDIFDLVSLRNAKGEQSDDNITDPDDFDKHHSSQDDFAYLVGIQLGENKKAGDWSFRADWRQTGIAAVDPNLNDSDFAAGELNTRGIKLGLAYNFTDFAIGAITYFHAWNLRNNLIGGEATGDNAIADSNTVRVLQIDFTVKF